MHTNRQQEKLCYTIDFKPIKLTFETKFILSIFIIKIIFKKVRI
jgi:hypothetical protein